jgi:hypothetical protein
LFLKTRHASTACVLGKHASCMSHELKQQARLMHWHRSTARVLRRVCYASTPHVLSKHALCGLSKGASRQGACHIQGRELVRQGAWDRQGKARGTRHEARGTRHEAWHKSCAHLSVLFFRHIEEKVTAIRAKAQRRQVPHVSTLPQTHVNTSESLCVHVSSKLRACVKAN